MKTKHDKPTIYEEITEKIIAALEDGVIPWARPWDAAQHGAFRNAITNRPYRGLNIMLLNLVAMLKGFVDPRWLTFRNAEKLGGNIRKGEKGVQVIFWKFLPVQSRMDDGEMDPDADATDDKERKVIPFARAYNVFNVEQCEGLDPPDLEPDDINSWLQILQLDSKAIFTAAAKAQNAADFVLDKAGIIDSHEAPLPAAA